MPIGLKERRIAIALIGFCAALPVATASIDPTAPVNALRGALERAGAIEALLPPVPRAQPTKPAPTGRQGT